MLGSVHFVERLIEVVVVVFPPVRVVVVGALTIFVLPLLRHFRQLIIHEGVDAVPAVRRALDTGDETEGDVPDRGEDCLVGVAQPPLRREAGNEAVAVDHEGLTRERGEAVVAGLLPGSGAPLAARAEELVDLLGLRDVHSEDVVGVVRREQLDGRLPADRLEAAVPLRSGGGPQQGVVASTIFAAGLLLELPVDPIVHTAVGPADLDEEPAPAQAFRDQRHAGDRGELEAPDVLGGLRRRRVEVARVESAERHEVGVRLHLLQALVDEGCRGLGLHSPQSVHFAVGVRQDVDEGVRESTPIRRASIVVDDCGERVQRAVVVVLEVQDHLHAQGVAMSRDLHPTHRPLGHRSVSHDRSLS